MRKNGDFWTAVTSSVVAIAGLVVLFHVDWRIAVGVFALFFAHNLEKHV